MTHWFAALAPSAFLYHQSFSTFASFTFREQFFIVGVRVVQSMLVAVRKSLVLLSVSLRFFQSRMFSSMTRAQLRGRVASWFIRRVAVASLLMITDTI